MNQAIRFHFARLVPLLVILFLSIPSLLQAQDSLRIGIISSLSDSWRCNQNNDLKLLGNTLYTTDQILGLRIFDINDTGQVEETGRYDCRGTHVGVVVRDELAYLAIPNEGLKILDTSDPSSILELGICTEITNEPSYIALYQNYALVTTLSGTFNVVDVSDPEAPTRTGWISCSATNVHAVVDHRAFLSASAGRRMTIVDLSNPAEPTVEGVYEESIDTIIFDIEVIGNYVYLVEGSRSGGDERLVILDISDPTTPELVETVPLHGSPHSISVAENVMYVAGRASTDGLLLFDITNPTSPDSITSVSTPRTAIQMDIDGSTLALATEDEGLLVFDISVPESPLEMGRYQPGQFIQSTILGNYAYIAGHSSGLRIFDIANPEAPIQLGHCETEGLVTDVDVLGDIACVVDEYSGVYLMNVSNPAAPTQLWQGNNSDTPVRLTDNLLTYGRHNNLHFVDITEPANANPVSSFNLDIMDPQHEEPVDFRFQDNLCYAVIYTSSPDSLHFCVLDTQDPSSIVLLGQLVLPGEPGRLFVEQNKAYVLGSFEGGSDWNMTVLEIDLSNPAQPELTGDVTFDMISFTDHAFVYDSYFYAVEGGNQLRMYDISEIENPWLVGFYPIPGSAHSLELQAVDNLLFVSTVTHFTILDCSEALGIPDTPSQDIPAKFGLKSAYPNPFNNSTYITLSLPSAARVEVNLYDLLGRRVAVLQNGLMSGGTNTLALDASHLASGTYFVQAKAKKWGSATQKIQLIK